MMFKYDFSQKCNTFINNFNKFERMQGKKKRGAISFKQKMLLKYGKELKRMLKGYLLFLQGLTWEKG